MPEPPPKFYKNPSIAIVLSFFWPGLGQLYNGQIGRGVMFMIAAGLSAALMWIVIGFVLYPLIWIWGLVDANSSAKRINQELAAE